MRRSHEWHQGKTDGAKAYQGWAWYGHEPYEPQGDPDYILGWESGWAESEARDLDGMSEKGYDKPERWDDDWF